MAADNSGTTVSTQTLVANTNASVSLTRNARREIELVHHGDNSAVVYFQTYNAEPLDDLTGGGADDEEPLLPGERLIVDYPESGEPIWIELISSGTPTVSVVRR